MDVENNKIQKKRILTKCYTDFCRVSKMSAYQNNLLLAEQDQLSENHKGTNKYQPSTTTVI